MSKGIKILFKDFFLCRRELILRINEMFCKAFNCKKISLEFRV